MLVVKSIANTTPALVQHAIVTLSKQLHAVIDDGLETRQFI